MHKFVHNWNDNVRDIVVDFFVIKWKSDTTPVLTRWVHGSAAIAVVSDNFTKMQISKRSLEKWNRELINILINQYGDTTIVLFH